MAEYKALRGVTIRTVAGDLSPVALGDIWYSSTTRKIRIGKTTAASWATGGTLNTARMYFSGAHQGTQTASLGFAGSAGPGAQDVTESYDGSTWTEVADTSTATTTSASAGTQSNPGPGPE